MLIDVAGCFGPERTRYPLFTELIGQAVEYVQFLILHPRFSST